MAGCSDGRMQSQSDWDPLSDSQWDSAPTAELVVTRNISDPKKKIFNESLHNLHSIAIFHCCRFTIQFSVFDILLLLQLVRLI